MKRLTISLVTYNSERYLHDFCDSLRAQTFDDWELVVVDNNSFDRSVAVIREHFSSAKIIQQKENLGFGPAQNLIIGWSRTPFILVINPDIVMRKDCIEKLMGAMERLADAAEIGGKLLYWDIASHTRTELIDSFCLGLARNYRAYDRLQGEHDRPAEEEGVFGVSGALVLLRREALDSVRVPVRRAHGYEYFDQDFFAYKEDVDLAWRFVNAGWKNYFIPQAVAYHHRTAAATRSGWKERKMRSEINRYSYRNHILMVYKNHYWPFTLRHFFSLATFEIGKFLYLAVLDRSSLRGLAEVFRFLPAFRRKRKFLLTLRKLRARQFAEYLSKS